MSQRPFASPEASQMKANEKEHNANLILALQHKKKLTRRATNKNAQWQLKYDYMKIVGLCHKWTRCKKEYYIHNSLVAGITQNW